MTEADCVVSLAEFIVECSSPEIEEMARVFGFCLVCCDAGTPGALLKDCDHER